MRILKNGFRMVFLVSITTALMVSCMGISADSKGADSTQFANPAAAPVSKDANGTNVEVANAATDIADPAVEMAAEWTPIVYDSSKKYIYLTFDDGPQNGTITCFDICKQLGVKATFFMVGDHANKMPGGNKIVSMIRTSYPQSLLANHSYFHASNRYKYFYQHPDMAEKDFYRAQDSLKPNFKIIRLPGNPTWVREGKILASNLVKPVSILLDKAGYNVIGWDTEWNFNHKTAAPLQSAEKLASEVDYAMNGNHTHVKNHLVILTHDRMFRKAEDAASLKRFITILKQNPNYVFETVDHYPGLKNLRNGK